MSDVDPDLSDVFRVLYGEEDDWGTFDDDETHRPNDGLAPDAELEAVDRAVDVHGSQQRYTKEYFSKALDSLLDHRPDTRKRVYSLRDIPNPIIPSNEPVPDAPEGYAPYSYLSLLLRLRTYNAATFSLFPEPLRPLELALKGWITGGRNSLVCGDCQASWNLASLEDIKDEGVRKEVAKRLGRSLQSRHLQGCPWRVKCSPEELHAQLRMSLHPMTTHSLGTLAAALEPFVTGLSFTSPLTSTQLSTLCNRLGAYMDLTDQTTVATAVALAMFGWYPHSSESRIQPITPPTEIISCRICQRRLGLWAFQESKGKKLDLVEEHLSWCPIRHGSWWDDAELLKEKKRGWDKDWLKVSDKLEEKPWRKRRKAT